jgi:hypothetical protein
MPLLHRRLHPSNDASSSPSLSLQGSLLILDCAHRTSTFYRARSASRRTTRTPSFQALALLNGTRAVPLRPASEHSRSCALREQGIARVSIHLFHRGGSAASWPLPPILDVPLSKSASHWWRCGLLDHFKQGHVCAQGYRLIIVDKGVLVSEFQLTRTLWLSRRPLSRRSNSRS